MTSSPEGRQEAAVKPLEWGEHPIPPTGECLASTAVGLYCIPLGRKLFALRFRDKDTLGEFDTLEAAQAAAQADYETRIRSALIPAKPAVEVVEALAEAEVYEQAAMSGIPAKGGDFIAGIEEYRKQLRLRAGQIRQTTDLGTAPASLLLSDAARDSDSPGVREAKESTPTILVADGNHLSVAIALAIDRGCGSGLVREDFDVAAPQSALGKAWHDAGIALAALQAPATPDAQTEV